MKSDLPQKKPWITPSIEEANIQITLGGNGGKTESCSGNIPPSPGCIYNGNNPPPDPGAPS